MAATPYHHGHLREALVAEAVTVVREHGLDGLAVRDLARRVGVSHNAAYRHFADRDALVAAVAEQGFAALTAAGEARMGAVADDDPQRRARRRLLELGRGYIAFALEEPGLFRVAFHAYPQTAGAPGMYDADVPDPLAQLNETLDGLVAVGYLHPDARPGAEITCWSSVHGFAVLAVDGPMRDVPDDVRDGLRDVMLSAIDRSYGATTVGGAEAWAPV